MAHYLKILAADPGKKGHHMGDYIPPEELEKFMSSCNDAAAQKAAKEAAERAKIQADNVGHKLLSKMGWKEGSRPLLSFFLFLYVSLSLFPLSLYKFGACGFGNCGLTFS